MTTKTDREFQPKQFYRDLELLLHHHDPAELPEDWFSWVAREIVVRFGPTLSIDSWRLYEEDDGGFVLLAEGGSRDERAVGLLVPADYRPLQLVFDNGAYIFDTSVEGQLPELEERLGGIESAAVLLNSEPRRILAFGLRAGWERDNLDFTLNTLRNAINLRLRLEDLRTDLEQAAEIQRSLLPERTPSFLGYGLAARSVPATTVGGDFYDFLLPDPDTLLFGVGDASGHGLGAALLARDVVTGLRMGWEGTLRITEVVSRLNRVIGRARLSSRFVSLLYAELDSDGTVFYVNAGHPPAWILGPDRVERLEVGGTILGPLEDASFRRGSAQIEPGEVLIVVTDGILERRDRDGNLFGDEGVERIVRGALGRTADEILEALFVACEAHGGGRPWSDDTTAIVLTRDR
jgi:sigma-B regulation protein RsbU (phosphoserine phosphatase)